MLRCFALLAVLIMPLAQAEEDGPETTPAEAGFVFDNATCPAFLTGIWLANSQQDVAPGADQAIWHVTQAMVFNADGTLERAFASGVAGDDPEETKTYGTWQAGPGPEKDRCALSLTYEEGQSEADGVTVLTRTRILLGGQPFTRSE